MKGRVAEKYAAESVRKAKGLSWQEWGGRVNEYLCKLDELIRPDLNHRGRRGASNKYEKFSPCFTVDTEGRARPAEEPGRDHRGGPCRAERRLSRSTRR